MPNLETKIPERMQDQGGDRLGLHGALRGIQKHEIDIRVGSKFAPSVAAERDQADAACRLRSRGLLIEREENRIRQIG